MSVPRLLVMPVAGVRNLVLAWFDDTTGAMDTTKAAVVIDLADAGGKQIALTTMTVCDGTGTQKSVIVLASQPF